MTEANSRDVPADPSADGAPLSGRAYQALRQAIVKGDFEPGARLRVEELTRRFAVSSSPVREALNRLTEQGLVRMLDNRGFRVAPITADGVSDISRVRQLVECEALRDALAHGDDAWEAQVVAAGHALALAERRLGDAPRALDDDWSARHRAFHLGLYAACTSALLKELADLLFDQAERYRRWAARHRSSPRHKLDEHQALLNAVTQRDTAQAVALLQQHIAGTERFVAAAMAAVGPH